MKLLVTGAAGNLGRRLAEALKADGFEIVGLDLVEPRESVEGVRFVQADLTDRAALDETLRELGHIDIAVHCASIHPWKEYSDTQYLDANIKGTWHFYSAAAQAGIGKVVLTSSIAAAGYVSPLEAWPVTEEMQFDLADLYSLTKKTQEDTARLFAAQKKIQTIALRPPMFIPLDDLQTGFWLTTNYALVDDIVSAHVAAARVLTGKHVPLRQPGMFEAVTIANTLPYQAEDAALMGPANNVLPLMRKYFPQAVRGLEEQGYEGMSLSTLYDLSKARQLLNWQAAYNFEQWWDKYSNRNHNAE